METTLQNACSSFSSECLTRCNGVTCVVETIRRYGVDQLIVESQ